MTEATASWWLPMTMKPAEWAEIVKEWRTSGQSARQFAAANRVTDNGPALLGRSARRVPEFKTFT